MWNDLTFIWFDQTFGNDDVMGGNRKKEHSSQVCSEKTNKIVFFFNKLKMTRICNGRY